MAFVRCWLLLMHEDVSRMHVQVVSTSYPSVACLSSQQFLWSGVSTAQGLPLALLVVLAALGSALGRPCLPLCG